MTPAQIRGMHGLVAQGCARCHSGPMLSDFKLHRLPVAPGEPGAPQEPDLGDGTGQFRTPRRTWRAAGAGFQVDGSSVTTGKKKG